MLDIKTYKKLYDEKHHIEIKEIKKGDSQKIAKKQKEVKKKDWLEELDNLSIIDND